MNEIKELEENRAKFSDIFFSHESFCEVLNWHEYNKTDLGLLKKAYKLAQEYGTDPSTQCGAIIVDNNNDIISYGFNHFPNGVQETKERWERPLKYSYVEHAERAAIYNAAKNGVKTFGQRMFAPWFACDNCARGIIEAGIYEVIGHTLPEELTPDHWKDSIKQARIMLEEAGVKMRWVPGKIGGVKIRFNGQIVEP